MKPWSKMSNEELALHLDLWLDLDGRVESKQQVEFFNELVWRLRLSEWNLQEGMKNE